MIFLSVVQNKHFLYTKRKHPNFFHTNKQEKTTDYQPRPDESLHCAVVTACRRFARHPSSANFHRGGAEM